VQYKEYKLKTKRTLKKANSQTKHLIYYFQIQYPDNIFASWRLCAKTASRKGAKTLSL